MWRCWANATCHILLHPQLARLRLAPWRPALHICLHRSWRPLFLFLNLVFSLDSNPQASVQRHLCEPSHLLPSNRTDQRLQRQALYSVESLDWLMRRAYTESPWILATPRNRQVDEKAERRCSVVCWPFKNYMNFHFTSQSQIWNIISC